MRRSLPPGRRSSANRTSVRGSFQKSRRLKKITDSSAEDRSLFMLSEHFWVTGFHVAVLDYSDLFSLYMATTIHQVPSDDLLESLYNMRIRGSGQL